MGGTLLQGMLHVAFLVALTERDMLRLSSTKFLVMNSQFVQVKMRATSGLHCKPGGEMIPRDILVSLGSGLKTG